MTDPYRQASDATGKPFYWSQADAIAGFGRSWPYIAPSGWYQWVGNELKYLGESVLREAEIGDKDNGKE